MSYLDMIVDLLRGLAVSVEVFVFTLLVALPLGFPIALGRMSRNRLVSGVFRLYVSIVRGTPLMLQIIFVYFSPYVLFGLPLSRYPRLLATVVAFGLNYAAYFAEIYRGGILSIERGQREAAAAMGFAQGQTFFRIILPQVVKRVIPAVGNEIITLVKDTALANVLAIPEIIKCARDMAATKALVWPLFYTAAFYLLFVGLLTVLLSKLEKKLDYFKV